MANAHPPENPAACTSAASAGLLIMGLAHAPRPTRIAAGRDSKKSYIPALVLALGMYY